MSDIMEMSGTEQAALLLLSMGEKSAANVMRHLSRDQVQMVSQSMARPNGIRHQEAQFVLGNFFNNYREQSGISGASRQYLQKTLDIALGHELAKNLLDSIYGEEIRADMQRLQWVELPALARLLELEHPQMQAVFLALLPPEMSSELLGYLPKESHQNLLLRIANLNEISKDVVEELHQLVNRCLTELVNNSGSRITGIKQVADMIATFQGDPKEMMKIIEDQDLALAKKVEEHMFDFIILDRQNEQTMQRIVQEVPLNTLAMALKGLEFKFRDKFIQAMPKRMVQTLQAEMEALGGVSMRRAEQARQDIMQLLRELMDAGEIEIQLFAAQVVE
ncbi:FliG C-terminal domain-containing protein [Paraferrimonas sp. SM1919]|uniref:FliG C-terminal domain-containing protein n=1 Tax=Paraferrimonas sp. SM1919 TaxID=2662263 RepID=UPI001969F6BB|nr:FliG C-terminal domain-containing protein [Paraferrimonas sp. SM1919]